MKRTKRRQRGKRRGQKLIELKLADAATLEKVGKSMLWSMSTWGGSRCPSCGIKIEHPSWLTNLSCSYGSTHITGFGAVCDRIRNCPGERDWEADERLWKLKAVPK